MSSRCPHNIVNFGPLAADICLPVWGTPANFNGFRDLAALQVKARQSSSEHQPNFAALNRGHHLCSAGRPSRLALAHSFFLFYRNESWPVKDPCVNYPQRFSSGTVGGTADGENSFTWKIVVKMKMMVRH